MASLVKVVGDSGCRTSVCPKACRNVHELSLGLVVSCCDIKLRNSSGHGVSYVLYRNSYDRSWPDVAVLIDID